MRIIKCDFCGREILTKTREHYLIKIHDAYNGTEINEFDICYTCLIADFNKKKK